MKISLSNTKVFNFLLFLFVVWGNIIIGIKWIDSVLNIMNVISRITLLSIIGLIAYLIIRKSGGKQKNELITDYCSLAIVIIVYLITGDNLLVFTVGLVIAAKGTQFDNIYITYFKAQLFSLITAIATCYLGLSQNIVSYFSYGNGYSWGMHHANNLAFIIATLYFGSCYLYLREKRWIQLSIAVVLTLIVWNVTVSRTACVLIVSYPIINGFIAFAKITNSSKILKYIKQIVLVLAFLSIIIALNYTIFSDGIFSDNTFRSRFMFGYNLLHEQGIHLFGSKIEYIGTVEARRLGTESIILDNAYLKLLINYGILSTIIVIYLLTQNINKAYKARNFELLSIMLIYVISGISENGGITVIGNITLLYYYCIDSNHLCKKVIRKKC